MVSVEDELIQAKLKSYYSSRSNLLGSAVWELPGLVATLDEVFGPILGNLDSVIEDILYE